MLWSLIACMHAPVQSQVRPEDMSTVNPNDLSELRDEEQAHVAARAALDDAQRDELRATRESEESEAEVTAKEADVRAAKAEVSAAETNRDAARIDQATAKLDQAEHDLDVARAKMTWKRAALKESEARRDEAESLVDLRLAELEMARVELVNKNGGSEKGYVVSDFIQQLASTREAWEKARQKTVDRTADTEEAKRAYDRLAGEVPVGTR